MSSIPRRNDWYEKGGNLPLSLCVLAIVFLMAFGWGGQFAEGAQAEVDEQSFAPEIANPKSVSPEGLSKDEKISTTAPATGIELGSHRSWYDTKSKTLTFPPPTLVPRPDDDLADRHSTIVKEVNPTAPEIEFSQKWSDFFTSIGPTFYWALRVLLWIAGISAIVAIIIWLALLAGLLKPKNWIRIKAKAVVEADNRIRDKAKVVDLPFVMESTNQSLIAIANLAREQARFDQSVIALFGHVLVELDAANHIRLQRGKTNRVYFGELKREPSLQRVFNDLRFVFEAVYFGKYPISMAECDRCWALLSDLERGLDLARKRQLANLGSSEPHEAGKNDTLPSGPRIEPAALIPWMIGIASMSACLGCTSKLPTEDYADLTSYTATKSIGGLSAFQSLCVKQKVSTNSVTVLTELSKKLDAILWVPKTFRQPTPAELSWFDDWLTQHPQRTLIYVGRDFSPSEDYWRQATENALIGDKRLYWERFAKAAATHDRMREEATLQTTNEWFENDIEEDLNQVVTKVKGPWAGFLTSAPRIPLRSVLVAPANTKSRHSGVLLQSSDEQPIVSQVEDKTWSGGRVILLSNVSVISNASIANAANRAIAVQLVKSLPVNARLGILAPIDEIPIRGPSDPNELKGFELLRVWPLSLISMQALFLGIVLLFALWPVFGRPRRVATPSTTDFGSHVEAMGELLQESNDRYFAAVKIAEYFRDVRKEPNSPWATILQAESKDEMKPTSHQLPVTKL